jgi:uncharacterized membrane protein
MVDRLPAVDPVPTPNRLMRIALLLSLAVNVAIVCTVIGFFAIGRPGGGPPRGFEVGLGPIVSALERQDRDAIRDRLRDRGGVRPMTREESRAAMRSVVDTLRTEPFDPSAINTFFETMRGRTANLQEIAQGALIEKLSGMTASEREAFAMRLEEEINRRGPRRN